ncbi:MAG TPA: carboxypeptidase-like regulatory domain-containing protein [Candidatus Acidoferrum sp.]|nr:carboxypeptidase-like regulatory domain-containing protein [Candidatus Acidoferrum sp.]
MSRADESQKSFGCAVRAAVCGVCLAFGVLSLAGGATAQSEATTDGSATSSAAASHDETRARGTIRGYVADRTNTAVAGATVTLTRADGSLGQTTGTDENGQFAFEGIAPGGFKVTINAQGFATQSESGVLHEGESLTVPQVTLVISTVNTEVSVTMTHVELAEAQIKDEEKQRVLGFVPNYYVSYVPDAASLNTKQKFELAWKTTINPVTFLITGAAAGFEQMQDQYGGYGQGAAGYGKRYGATYADVVTGNFIGAALLPSLMKQDPRYFYKGTGSKKSRILYALANMGITKGDNGKWQANYSGLLGSLAAAGISNLYYPANERGASLTLENFAITVAAGGAANILQEFVIKKLTPNTQSHTNLGAGTQP